MTRFVGTEVEFGADTDEFALSADARELPLIHSDTHLNDLLLKHCEAALADRRGDMSQLRTRVENAISSVLPHGRVLVEDVARSLGMSERTLARRLSDEGLNFTEILQQLRRDLAVRYLDDRKLHVSKIAWLLGFRDVSAFTIAGVVTPKIASGRRSTSSFANVLILSASAPLQRNSIRRLLPSVHPSFASAARNAASQACAVESLSA
jgi:AraC-like DNA-binding protein